jgi:hypothetical protein
MLDPYTLCNCVFTDITAATRAFPITSTDTLDQTRFAKRVNATLCTYRVLDSVKANCTRIIFHLFDWIVLIAKVRFFSALAAAASELESEGSATHLVFLLG